MKSLQEGNWLDTQEKISGDNHKRILGLMFYLFHIPEKTRKESLSLSFKSGSKLIDFISELDIKVQECTNNAEVKSTFAAPFQTKPKTHQRCLYCKQEGLFANHCPSKRLAVSKPNQGSEAKGDTQITTLQRLTNLGTITPLAIKRNRPFVSYMV